MLMFVTFMCMVFHNQSVVKKTKERNFNLTKNQGYIPIPIYQIIFTFNNIKPRMHHLHWDGISVNSYQKSCKTITIF